MNDTTTAVRATPAKADAGTETTASRSSASRFCENCVVSSASRPRRCRT